MLRGPAHAPVPPAAGMHHMPPESHVGVHGAPRGMSMGVPQGPSVGMTPGGGMAMGVGVQGGHPGALPAQAGMAPHAWQQHQAAMRQQHHMRQQHAMLRYQQSVQQHALQQRMAQAQAHAQAQAQARAQAQAQAQAQAHAHAQAHAQARAQAHAQFQARAAHARAFQQPVPFGRPAMLGQRVPAMMAMAPGGQRTARANSMDSEDSEHRIGVYTRAQRDRRIQRWLHKRKRRVNPGKIRYLVRSTFANKRPRTKGRFVPVAQLRAEQAAKDQARKQAEQEAGGADAGAGGDADVGEAARERQDSDASTAARSEGGESRDAPHSTDGSDGTSSPLSGAGCVVGGEE